MDDKPRVTRVVIGLHRVSPRNIIIEPFVKVSPASKWYHLWLAKIPQAKCDLIYWHGAKGDNTEERVIHGLFIYIRKGTKLIGTTELMTDDGTE